MSARQEFIEQVKAPGASLLHIALLAVQILKNDGEAAEAVTRHALDQFASLTESSRAAGCEGSLELLVSYLGDELGYAGNADDYYSPDNSDLSLVLSRRSGIPITLAILYIEVGQALGFDLRGIGFPGHFLVGHFSAGATQETGLIDPYAGRLTDRKACLKQLARSQGGSQETPNWPGDQVDAWFAPATPAQIALRLLENLKQIHLQTGQHGKALAALELQLLVAPESFELLEQQRALMARIFGRDDQAPVH